MRIDSHRADATALAAFVVPSPTSAGIQTGATAPRIALRAFRPPAVLEVFESGGRPTYVRGPGFGGRVVQLAGPWRICGEWWTADPYERAYYDVDLSDGGLYRVYCEGSARRWLADGMYD